MRIVAGKFKGRALVTPAGGGTRPTSDRVREAVFNILAHGMSGFEIVDARVIDLFAGTGALGIEALSRGAHYCLLVEQDVEARGVIRRNIEAFGLTSVARIYRRDATDMGPAGNVEPFTLVFLDPPYGKGLGEKALASLIGGGWLAPGAAIVFEERAGTRIAWPEEVATVDERTWGDTTVFFACYRGAGAGA